MDPDRPRVVRLDVRIDSDEERAALEQALLRAQASEHSEVRRRETRLVAGYGDAVTRESMTSELASARSRWTMLERVLAALRGPTAERG
jgi:hypothetical protein